ncbi:hypothetical protein FYC77_11825 [Natrialba swarupiae]|uniref:Uncharacterized protein n=1 Tax=Natrialba swarupiae TaxID=2448032 RepID=A0A5D5ALQ0_9EURY|nr:hypothetical protein FYC77_11825 [Natrialba swarupiae]
MVTFPPGESQDVCAICREPFEEYDPEFAQNYANLVCEACDKKAVTKHGSRDRTKPASETHGNPVYIDGQKCWRRYRFGGYITRLDEHDCDTIEEFHQKHREEFSD